MLMAPYFFLSHPELNGLTGYLALKNTFSNVFDLECW